MKKISILSIFLFTSSLLLAQSPLGKGGRQFNAGLGFSSFGVPIYAGVDFGIHDDITIGPQISYRKYSDRIIGIDYNLNLIIIGLTGNYHFDRILDIPSEWNVYAGLSLNYYSWSTPSNYPGNRSSDLNIDLQIGGRYFWSENWAANLELGGGTSSGGKIGITYIF